MNKIILSVVFYLLLSVSALAMGQKRHLPSEQIGTPLALSEGDPVLYEYFEKRIKTSNQLPLKILEAGTVLQVYGERVLFKGPHAQNQKIVNASDLVKEFECVAHLCRGMDVTVKDRSFPNYYHSGTVQHLYSSGIIEVRYEWQPPRSRFHFYSDVWNTKPIRPPSNR